MANPPGNLPGISVWKPIAGTNPVAGAEISETVPAGKYWLLQSVMLTLAQGITDTPRPILTLDDGTTVFYESIGSSAAQAVSTTCKYGWAPGHELSGQVGVTTGVHSNAPLASGMILGPGYRIKTVTLGLTSTGDYAAPQLYVCEFGL